MYANRRNFHYIKEIEVEEHDGYVRFKSGRRNTAVSCMRNASGHNYRNSSFIVDLAMGQIQNGFLVLLNNLCNASQWKMPEVVYSLITGFIQLPVHAAWTEKDIIMSFCMDTVMEADLEADLITYFV